MLRTSSATAPAAAAHLQKERLPISISKGATSRLLRSLSLEPFSNATPSQRRIRKTTSSTAENTQPHLLSHQSGGPLLLGEGAVAARGDGDLATEISAKASCTAGCKVSALKVQLCLSPTVAFRWSNFQDLSETRFRLDQRRFLKPTQNCSALFLSKYNPALHY